MVMYAFYHICTPNSSESNYFSVSKSDFILRNYNASALQKTYLLKHSLVPLI